MFVFERPAKALQSLTGTGHRRASQVLSSGPWSRLSSSSRSFDADFGLLVGWSYATLPSPTQWHDLASYIGIDSHVYSVASGGEQAC
jgi:hypothetical protein